MISFGPVLPISVISIWIPFCDKSIVEINGFSSLDNFALAIPFIFCMSFLLFLLLFSTILVSTQSEATLSLRWYSSLLYSGRIKSESISRGMVFHLLTDFFRHFLNSVFLFVIIHNHTYAII